MGALVVIGARVVGFRLDAWGTGSCDGFGVVASVRDSGGAAVFTVDFAALEQLGGVLRGAAERFEAQVDLVRFAQERLLAGAGQFAGHLELGAAGFAVSWRVTFEVCAASTRLVAHNLGRLVVDVQATDADLAGRVVL